jgi:signal transduction histidine kinase/ActR/RegA family two-component response regulator
MIQLDYVAYAAAAVAVGWILLASLLRRATSKESADRERCDGVHHSRRCLLSPDKQCHLRSLSRVLPGLLFQLITEPDGAYYYAYASEAIVDIYGVRPEDVRTTAVSTFENVHPDDRPVLVGSFEHARQHMLLWDLEYRVCHPTKGTIVVHTRATPDLLPDGSILWSGYTTDVTQDQRTLKELEMANSRFELARQSMRMGVYDWDAREDVLTWEDGMFPLYGRSPKNFTHRYEDWASCVHPDDLEKVETVIAEEIPATGNFGPIIFRAVVSDDEIKYVQASGIGVLNEDGTIQRLVGINLDVTDSVVTQQSLQEAKEAAESAAQAKSLFLAAMSHEVRTPLHGVLGMLTLLEESDLTEQQHEWASDARASASNLLVLINDILDYSKLEASRLPLHNKPFDPTDAIQEVVTLFQPSLQEKGLDFELNAIVDGQPMKEHKLVMGDAARVRQVVLNYLSNAIKFTRSGKISLNYIYSSANSHRCKVRVEVCDTGIGLSREVESCLFQPFVQGDRSSTREFGGTGLGLAISKQLVYRMGGELGAYSNPSGGSTFWFEIPFERADGIDEQSKIRIPSPKLSYDLSSPFDLHDVHVLLAEDSPINQKLVKAYLGPSQCQLDVVSNGMEAVEAVRQRDYDVVLMDIQMPVMDGVTATHSIKSMQAEMSRRCPYIIALTANAMVGDRERFLEAGMDEYISKPVSKRTLLHKIIAAYQSMQATCG